MPDSLYKNSRAGFIKKVYGILAAQLTLAAIMITTSVFSDGYKKFMITHIWLEFVAIFVMFISMYAITCYHDLARSVPTNYILLLVFTVSFSYVATALTAFVAPAIVCQAAVLTAVITISITI